MNDAMEILRTIISWLTVPLGILVTMIWNLHSKTKVDVSDVREDLEKVKQNMSDYAKGEEVRELLRLYTDPIKEDIRSQRSDIKQIKDMLFTMVRRSKGED